MMANEEKRRKRIQTIANTIKKAQSCGKLKLVYATMEEFNCSRRTVLEYLSQLINNEHVTETAGILTWKKS